MENNLKEENQFHIWRTYWGKLICDHDDRFPSTLYGFENISPENQGKNSFDFTEESTLWGFVQSGNTNINVDGHDWSLRSGQWFNLTGRKITLNFSEKSSVYITARFDYIGLNSIGGPIEATGRLQYIDGCTDTLLAFPPIQGDPCLNLLHFPPGINQTMHTHPSTRTGMVSSGTGFCVTPDDEIELSASFVFYLPQNTKHNFTTQDSVMNVVSYHPDSDWGPTHEKHPMINRTWVDGEKIDNTKK
jgi:quercetin dioxygenase-like cupin family protein